MQDIEFSPNKVAPLMLQEKERALMINEGLMITEEIENKLRFAVTEGDGLIIYLEIDEFEELLDAIGAVTNYCKNKQKKRRWVKILEKILSVVESYVDVDEEYNEPKESLDDFLNSNFPPELVKRIKLKMGSEKFPSLENLNAVIGEVMKHHNQEPQEDMGGLSPEQVHQLIFADWDNSDSLFQINSDLPIEDILQMDIIQDARLFLSIIIEEGGSVKKTKAGNLNRQFIHQMLDKGRALSESEAWIIKYKKTLNEDDIPHISILRIISEMAGLIRKYHNLFKITKKGASLVQEKNTAKLATLLFNTYFCKFNLSFMDRMRNNYALQETITYSFYTIGKQLLDWKKPDEIAEQITLPIVQEYAFELHFFDSLIEIRILKPLFRFGLIEQRELPKKENDYFKNTEYRKTALYDIFFQFNGLERVSG
jgi:hypothetical protein